MRSPTKKQYPLKVECLEWDYDPIYYSKGWHETEDFIAAVKEFDPKAFEVDGIDPKRVVRKWFRTRFDLLGWSDYDFLIEDAEPHSRGAYPVTVLEWWSA